MRIVRDGWLAIRRSRTLHLRRICCRCSRAVAGVLHHDVSVSDIAATVDEIDIKTGRIGKPNRVIQGVRVRGNLPTRS